MMTQVQPFRRLTEARILRALQSGGMIAVREGQAVVHRRRDGRSLIVGGVPPHVLARLQSDEKLRADRFGDRLVVREQAPAAALQRDATHRFDPEGQSEQIARAAERSRAD